MANKKKSKKKELKFENEVLIYIIALALIVISLIAILRQGLIGEFLSNIGRFLVGSYYWVLCGFKVGKGFVIKIKNNITIKLVKNYQEIYEELFLN